MPRVRTTEETLVPVRAGDREYDSRLGVYAVFLSVPRVETAYFRLVVESWEDFAVARTMQRFDPADPSRSIVVVMAVPGYLEPCVKSLSRLAAEIEGCQVEATAELCSALRRDLLDDAPADPLDDPSGSSSG